VTSGTFTAQRGVRLRECLVSFIGVARESWDYVNWLTHAKNAVRMDAEMGL
jgi:hypothetical protein